MAKIFLIQSNIQHKNIILVDKHDYVILVRLKTEHKHVCNTYMQDRKYNCRDK